MSQIAIVNMKVQPGKYEEAVAFMQKHIPDTASFLKVVNPFVSQEVQMALR